MIIVYQEHIEVLESEVKTLKEEIEFLQTQLEYKTMGPPIHSQEEINTT